MIDDRRKPSSPPPTGDESVEILATDNTISSARRRASRKLRVPNDHVPRRAEEPSPPAHETEALVRDISGDTEVSFSHTEPGPVTEETAARLTDPSEPPRGMAIEAREKARDKEDAPPVSAPRSVPPGAMSGGIGTTGRVPRPNMPSTPPPAAAAKVEAPKVEAPKAEATKAEEPKVEAVEQRSTPVNLAPAPTYSDPPPRVIDENGVVRQVRRKIRSVGTGSVPPPPKRVEVIEEPRRPDAPATNNGHVDIAVPAVASMSAGDDDFVVPPDESLALRAPAVPSFEIQTDPGESVDFSVDDAPQLDTSSTAESDADTDTLADTEVLEDPTEEVEIPAARAVGARSSSPDTSANRPPPPKPPPAPAKVEPPVKAEPASRPTIAEPSAKKKRRPWWEEVFSDDYFRTMPKHSALQTTTEGDFIEASLGVEKGAVVLDVACGDGRQAIELATRGYEMIALDLSLPMLSRAADTAQDRGAKLNFLHSDMREMEFNEMFDAAYCMNTSFGFFDDEKNIDVAQRIWRGLKSGGTLLLEVLNRDYAIQSQPAMTWYEGDGCVCMEETSFNYITSRLVVKRTMIFDDGRQRENEYTVRLYALHELGTLLHNAGFRIVEVSGHARTPGAFFGNASRHLIILAQKKAAPVAETPSSPAPAPATETPGTGST